LKIVDNVVLPGGVYRDSTDRYALVAAASGLKLFDFSGNLVMQCSDCSGQGRFLDGQHILDIPARHRGLRVLDLQGKQTAFVKAYGHWITEAHNGTFAILAGSERRNRSIAVVKLASIETGSVICEQPHVSTEHHAVSTAGDWALALAPDIRHVAIYSNGRLTLQRACSAK
jgi:hypothetical protein